LFARVLRGGGIAVGDPVTVPETVESGLLFYPAFVP
jgi:MOSC domain-containing protein YiiM